MCLQANEVKRAIQLRNIVTRLGPAYIKLGQALSIRPDILSTTAMNELQKLCDKVSRNSWQNVSSSCRHWHWRLTAGSEGLQMQKSLPLEGRQSFNCAFMTLHQINTAACQKGSSLHRRPALGQAEGQCYLPGSSGAKRQPAVWWLSLQFELQTNALLTLCRHCLVSRGRPVKFSACFLCSPTQCCMLAAGCRSLLLTMPQP